MLANLVLMPQMGISEESAILTQWHVKKGDTVNQGDKLFSIETGKATFDVESEHSGVVLELIASEGDEVLIKLPVCAVGTAGEVYVSETKAAATVATAVEAVQPQAVASLGSVVNQEAVQRENAIKGISPRARALASKADVDPSTATPTGAEGRIIERDVRSLIENGATSPVKAVEAVKTVEAGTANAVEGYQEKPLSNMRKIIAKNMMASLSQTAQLTHTASFDATSISEYRKLLKADPVLSGVTLTDMILYAVTRTLKEFPLLNAWLMGDTMRYFDDVNLACAVDTDKGLMVPVMFGASSKSLLAMSKELKTLAEGCRNGTIAPNLLSGGSFTVSNLGAFGIESFTPILNAPQTGILGVNTITQRVRDVDGKMEMYPCMTLSLTYDHRAVDGAPASKFLQALCKNLERFQALLAQ